jgi:hypothetical protein
MHYSFRPLNANYPTCPTVVVLTLMPWHIQQTRHYSISVVSTAGACFDHIYQMLQVVFITLNKLGTLQCVYLMDNFRLYMLVNKTAIVAIRSQDDEYI